MKRFRLALLEVDEADNIVSTKSNYTLEEDEAKLVIDGEGDSLIDWLVDQLEEAGVLSDDDEEAEDDESDDEEVE